MVQTAKCELKFNCSKGVWLDMCGVYSAHAQSSIYSVLVLLFCFFVKFNIF